MTVKCENCVNSEMLKELKQNVKDIEKRLTKIESDKQLQDYQHKQVMETLEEMKDDLKDIKSTPTKNWNTIITAMITGVVAFIVSYILR